MKCELCTGKAVLSGNCRFCEKQYCSLHRLPESHQCSKLSLCKEQAYERNKKDLEEHSLKPSKLIKF